MPILTGYTRNSFADFRSRRSSPTRSNSPPHRSDKKSQSNQSPPTPVEEHSRFYFDDDIVSFIVENRVKIRIHKHFLARESSFFRGVFASGPRGPENTYVVNGLSINEFESLLSFFYDGMYLLSPTTAPIQSWVDILSIATQYDLPKVREHAIIAIDTCQSFASSSNCLSPAEIIHVADKYGVEKWLKPAYLALCEREVPLSKEEAAKIGMEKVVMIAHARERLLRIKLDAIQVDAAGIKEEEPNSRSLPSDTDSASQPKLRPGWRTVQRQPHSSRVHTSLDPAWGSPPPRSPPVSPRFPPGQTTTSPWSSASDGTWRLLSKDLPPPATTQSSSSVGPPVPLADGNLRESSTIDGGNNIFQALFGTDGRGTV
ncbi:hypothetical protein E1B28_006374 [Marasmius oreades]|uniref:BTB domain-containing protein n=1 Tax=Marasmius oreades TaxID=181124 RepID=A0A9P7S5D6_9AGAR|nr:uncharacterized protein E1B28_006374 [Marasmius oreades]KAG7095652.1 hypothetical protein E1B28_006374 [Marasmius oreades]